jgi:predicted nucleic-acid-binding Zn-ribbon protein
MKINNYFKLGQYCPKCNGKNFESTFINLSDETPLNKSIKCLNCGFKGSVQDLVYGEKK